MEKLEIALNETPLLRGMAPAMIKTLAQMATTAQFGAGDMLFREGDDARQLYILTHGKVALEIYALERGPIAVQTIGEGEALGWSWLVPPHRWRFGARSVGVTRVIAWDAEKLRAMCEQDNVLGYALVKRVAALIAGRLEATRLQLIDLYGVSN
jgi:CRP-like cAMP-binding protein